MADLRSSRYASPASLPPLPAALACPLPCLAVPAAPAERPRALRVPPNPCAFSFARSSQVSAFAELHRVNRVLALSTSIRPPLHPRCKQTRYVVWYTRRQRQPPGQRSATSYEDSIRRIADFSTVEGFWGCYCRMVRPSALPAPTDVHVFKDGIRPLWEDAHNRRGGKWMVRLRKPLTARMWEQLLMAVAGEQLEGAEEVCGVVLSVRFGEDILSIWNRSAPHSLARDRLCESIRKHLNLPPSYTMVRHAFRLHAIHHPLMLSTTPSFCLSPCALASSPALASSLPSPPPCPHLLPALTSSLPSPPPCPHLLPALTSSLPSPPPCPHLLPALTSSLPSPPPCPHLLPALTSSLPVTPPGVQAARRLTQGPFLLPQHLGAHIAHGHSAQRARQGDKSGCSIP
ncbi:unnamed protein product [Closterium sp. Naga37s-1]|nr:unnamed protein product [Closterium sp. Naga37s-1]